MVRCHICGDPAHVLVIRGDDPAEGDLVARDRSRSTPASRRSAVRVIAPIPHIGPEAGHLSQPFSTHGRRCVERWRPGGSATRRPASGSNEGRYREWGGVAPLPWTVNDQAAGGPPRDGTSSRTRPVTGSRWQSAVGAGCRTPRCSRRPRAGHRRARVVTVVASTRPRSRWARPRAPRHIVATGWLAFSRSTNR